MSKKPQSEEQERAAGDGEAVARYLREHPEFFTRRPALLTELRLPHPESGRAMSLIERQVRVLRDRNRDLERERRELVAVARQNDQANARLHRFALALLDAAYWDEALSGAQDILRQEFALDAVTVRLAGASEGAHPRAELTVPGDRRLEAAFERCRERPLCGGALDGETGAWLFGDAAGALHSSALIALHPRRPAPALRGLLALGSHDPQRFHADMGTAFLTRLGELLIGGLARHL